MMKCNSCGNYMKELDTCKFCHFEPSQSTAKGDWDILNLEEENGWEHIQIRDRLHSQGIDCYEADIWFDKNMAFLIGVDSQEIEKVAKALGIHRDVIYADGDHRFLILNLYQEKHLRKEEVDEPHRCEDCKHFIDSVFGDCKLGNLNDENIIYDDGRMRVNCMEWERKE